MKNIFVSQKVETCIEELKTTGKAGTILARKAACIIESLASGEAQNPRDAFTGFTKYGEKRIRNCRKYDLGCGYRLITLEQGETLFVPFLGTHDHCQRWLKNNSKLKDFNAGAGRTIRVVEKEPAKQISERSESVDNPADRHGASIPLTDKDLRMVFSGLAQGLK